MKQEKRLEKVYRAAKRTAKKTISFLTHQPIDETDELLRCDWPLEKRISGAMDLYELKQGYRFDINNP